jgi:hypothetical protein
VKIEARRAGGNRVAAKAHNLSVEFRVTEKMVYRGDLSMTNEERKREKAVKRIETAVSKAVSKGVSKKVIEDAVGLAIIEAREKASAKKVAVHRTPDEKTPRKKKVAKKAPAKKAIIKKSPGKKAVAKKASAEEVIVKEAPAAGAVAKTI